MRKAVCVYGASRMGSSPAFQSEAIQLGRGLAESNADIVYGGANVGLMREMANAAKENGSRVIGVIPTMLVEKELAHDGLDELHVVEGMHERKAKMMARADAFVAMPGGVGTLEELFEVVTWTQIGLLKKPIAILNVAGFYDALLAFMEGAVQSELVPRETVSALIVEPTAARICARCRPLTATALTT